MNYEKPPLGIMPEIFYEKLRIQDLCRVLHEYTNELIQGEHLEIWANELRERIIKYNKMNKKI